MPWGVHLANGGNKASYPEFSGRILDLKDGKDNATPYFNERIEPELQDGIVIVVVPSHDPAKLGGGLKKLAGVLAQNGKRVDGSDCLVRTQKIDKLARGGDRSKDVHMRSVSVARPDLIKGQHVLLLDDVAKTGNSLSAGRDLLLAAGAQSVECATIGKT